MIKYIFILGNNPELSVAEIAAVLPKSKIIKREGKFLVAENSEFDSQAVLDQLGGTIKIGRVISSGIDKEVIMREIVSRQSEGKVKFGLSFYGVKSDRQIGMAIKRELKEQGTVSRLVTSRDNDLSSVIVKKEKVIDFLVLPEYLGLTLAVQDFEDYSRRDYGRPKSDSHSGMIPPKLAKMMINLSGVAKSGTILDPFCGSGTILSEAVVMGYGGLIGCDNSAKAVGDTKENLIWLIDKFEIENLKSEIYLCDVSNLSSKVNINSIDAIITEPYLGPPIRGSESPEMIKKIVKELEDLYVSAFSEYKKVLKKDAKVVMVFPQWHLGGNVSELNISDRILKLGFGRIDAGDLIYKRESQKVRRQITIWRNI